jgi:hypothetical protein
MLGVRMMRRDAVILVDADGAPIVQRVRPFDRIRARLRARALDRALAAGKPSESEPAVALRARRLTEISKRAELARTLSQVVNRARQASSTASPHVQVPIARRAVLGATDELSELASELVAPGPVGAGGVAQVQLLISDGTGPLYNPNSRVDLPTAVRRAIEALRLYRRQPAW